MRLIESQSLETDLWSILFFQTLDGNDAASYSYQIVNKSSGATVTSFPTLIGTLPIPSGCICDGKLYFIGPDGQSLSTVNLTTYVIAFLCLPNLISFWH